MTVSLVQSASDTTKDAGHTTIAATLPGAPTIGNTLCLTVLVHAAAAITITATGFTQRISQFASEHGDFRVFTKVSDGTETTVTVTHTSSQQSYITVDEIEGTYGGSVGTTVANASNPKSIPGIAPAAGLDVLLLAIASERDPYNLTSVSSGYTVGHNIAEAAGYRVVTFWDAVSPTDGGSYSAGVTFANTVNTVRCHLAHVYFVPLVPALEADFSATPRTGEDPLSVAFTDESIGGNGTINTWLWDFGDGATSTTQDPTHEYVGVGSYTVSLTVTTDEDETDSLTRTAYIVVTGDYVAPDPGGAILEIKASAVGSHRWGIATWGESVWAASQWVDITPQGITVTIRWGSHSPEKGILTETEAASWLVTTYDPERLLDPGNEDSPHHADLVAGLPIRLRHRGTIIRQGYCERIAYFHADNQGGIRATDNVSLMARTPVPSDSVVADTLRERARDVIAAAGLRITVEPDPPAGDPALAPRLDGDRSVWRHIADAAEQVLHIPYVDRVGTLKFRPWASPYDRGRGVDETNLVDLGTQVDTAGLYSVVQARDEVSEDIVERRLTPAPRWGSVTVTRDELTPDADAWADAVLADRSLQTVQYLPGLIWPLTADDVEYFATLEAMERFGVDHSASVPAVHVTGIIVGGQISVKGKKDSAALWTFELELAQTADAPLYVDDADPPEFLYHEDGFTLLYPG